VAELSRLTTKIGIQLHLVAENCTIFSSRSRWPVRKLVGTPSYMPSPLQLREVPLHSAPRVAGHIPDPDQELAAQPKFLWFLSVPPNECLSITLTRGMIHVTHHHHALSYSMLLNFSNR